MSRALSTANALYAARGRAARVHADNEAPLTDKQRICLDDAIKGVINPWDYGSTTISRLKRLGYIEPAKFERESVTRYVATEAARKKYAGASCKGWNFHVFALGEEKCSMCGWNRSES